MKQIKAETLNERSITSSRGSTPHTVIGRRLRQNQIRHLQQFFHLLNDLMFNLEHCLHAFFKRIMLPEPVKIEKWARARDTSAI